MKRKYISSDTSEVDFAFGVFQKFVNYSPGLFPTSASRTASRKLLERLKDAHAKAALVTEFPVPPVFDYLTLAQFLRALWSASAAVFDTDRVVEMEVRSAIIRIHLAITELREKLDAPAIAKLGYSPFAPPWKQGRPRQRGAAA